MASRSYTINGVEYPSVTTILGMLDKGEALLGWAVRYALQHVREHAYDQLTDRGVPYLEGALVAAQNNWREARDTAADIGKEVHSLIHQYIRHGKDAVGAFRPEVENGFLAFLEWEKENQVQWLESEKEVFDPVHGYAGTLDAKGYFQNGLYSGRVFVIDFKSSKGFYDGYAEQLAGYRNADDLTAQRRADGMGILRLDKETGIPEFKDFSDSYESRRAFFFALTHAYYLQKARRLKGNPYVGRGIGLLSPFSEAPPAPLRAA